MLDEQPLLGDDLLAVAEWMSRYYLYDAASAYLLALPALLRGGEAAELVREKRVELTTAGEHLEADQLKGQRQREALRWLQTHGAAIPSELRRQGIERPHWRGLVDKRLAQEVALSSAARTPTGQLRRRRWR